MPAIQPYIIEPIWEQFAALLPERKTDHPLGCHRRRIPDRVVFEKLVQVLVFGCAYWRIADEQCSARSTLRRRRDEWIDHGAMDALEEIVKETYDRTIGLELSDIAVDCCITKAPCGGQRSGREARWTGAREASNARWPSMPMASRSEPWRPRPIVTTPHCWPRLSEYSGGDLGRTARLGKSPSGPRLRLRPYPQALDRARSGMRDLGEGEALSAWDYKPLGGGADELLAKRPHTRSWCGVLSGEARSIDFWIAFSSEIIIVGRLVRKA